MENAPYFVVLLVFVAVGGVGFALAGNGGGAASKRVKALGDGARRGGRLSAIDQAMSKRRQANLDAVKEMAEREREQRRNRLSISGRLEQAALPITEQTFWLFSAAAGVAVAGLLFFLKAPLPIVGAGLLVGGLGLPRWALAYLISARQKKFLSQFADGIDLIVRGVKSGLPINQCLQIVAMESPEPLSSEFRAVTDGASMGVPLSQNMQRLYERMPLQEVNFFGIVLIIQQKTGGNLAEALGNLSNVLRSRRLLKEKIGALSAEAKASAMIIGFLPFGVGGFVYITRPDYMGVMFTDDMGKLILMGCAAMVSLGIFVMYRMVNFKY